MITKREASIAMRHARQKPLRPWQRAGALLLAISVAACGTAPQQAHPPTPQESGTADTPYRIPPGSTIAVAMASFDPPSADVDTSESAVSSPSGGNGLSELGKNVGIYTLGGAARVGAYAILCGPAILICLPFLAAVGGIGGAVVGLVATAETAADTARIDPETEPVNLEDAKLLAARPLTQRIYDYARERGLGTLPPLSDSPPLPVSERLRSGGGANYVFEIAPPTLKKGYYSDGSNRQWLRVNAWGRLVRVSDNVVVARFEDSTVGVVMDAEPLSAELDLAMQRLAEAFVDRWMATAITRSPAPYRNEAAASSHAQNRQTATVSKESGPQDVESSTEKGPVSQQASLDDKPPKQEQIAADTAPAAPQPLAAMSPTPTRAPAKPVAIEVGGLRQGDRWEYAFVDSRNGRPTSRRFEIEQVDGDEIIERIELEDGKTLTAVHHDGAYINMLGGMQFAPYYAAFGSAAPSEAVDNVRVEGGDACGGAPMTLYNTYECEVSAVFEGSETVTVPVGTFEAQRVRVKVYQQVWGSTAAGNLSGVVAYGQFWVSPDAGRIVKAVINYETDHPWTETMDLVSHRARGQPAATAR